ncbi:hypothetical protein DPMN_014365 [Dreissena polymorpha]|uniref:Double-stranded RNA-specific adenosine deaminase n=3 Tax=Dreissena polymorpha TaxID=45954 RepID=A0A9D4NAM6_DREPO|nr:hypothetical protein DPMN_014365 [Dreissena polymorpha]
MARKGLVDKITDSPPVWAVGNSTGSQLSLSNFAEGRALRSRTKRSARKTSSSDITDKILEYLSSASCPKKSLDIAKGIGFTRSADVNSTLYQLEKGGLVVKHARKPPLWSAVKQQMEDEEGSVSGPVGDQANAFQSPLFPSYGNVDTSHQDISSTNVKSEQEEGFMTAESAIHVYDMGGLPQQQGSGRNTLNDQGIDFNAWNSGKMSTVSMATERSLGYMAGKPKTFRSVLGLDEPLSDDDSVDSLPAQNDNKCTMESNEEMPHIYGNVESRVCSNETVNKSSLHGFSSMSPNCVSTIKKEVSPFGTPDILSFVLDYAPTSEKRTLKSDPDDYAMGTESVEVSGSSNYRRQTEIMESGTEDSENSITDSSSGTPNVQENMVDIECSKDAENENEGSLNVFSACFRYGEVSESQCLEVLKTIHDSLGLAEFVLKKKVNMLPKCLSDVMQKLADLNFVTGSAKFWRVSDEGKKYLEHSGNSTANVVPKTDSSSLPVVQSVTKVTKFSGPPPSPQELLKEKGLYGSVPASSVSRQEPVSLRSALPVSSASIPPLMSKDLQNVTMTSSKVFSTDSVIPPLMSLRFPDSRSQSNESTNLSIKAVSVGPTLKSTEQPLWSPINSVLRPGANENSLKPSNSSNNIYQPTPKPEGLVKPKTVNTGNKLEIPDKYADYPNRMTASELLKQKTAFKRPGQLSGTTSTSRGPPPSPLEILSMSSKNAGISQADAEEMEDGGSFRQPCNRSLDIPASRTDNMSPISGPQGIFSVNSFRSCQSFDTDAFSTAEPRQESYMYNSMPTQKSMSASAAFKGPPPSPASILGFGRQPTAQTENSSTFPKEPMSLPSAMFSSRQNSNDNSTQPGSLPKSLTPASLSLALSSKSFAALNKNPVSALMEYAQLRKMVARVEVVKKWGASHKPTFEMAAFVDNRKFPSITCHNKKDGRKEACDLALRQLVAEGQFQETKTASATQSLIQSGSLKPMTHFDTVAALTHRGFTALVSGIQGEAFAGRKVIAGLVMKRSEEDVGVLVSFGTGNRCITGQQLSLQGNTVNDSHAEIITRRGFIRFLYKQLRDYEVGKPHPMFESSSTGHLRVRDNITFHLYISTAPCGDGALFSPRDADAQKTPVDPRVRPPHEPTFSSNVQGLTRTKVEGGEGTIPIEADFKGQTFDGIQRGERLRTMSCTDKICRWNVLGLQGALLSHFLDPVYLDSLTLGLLYEHGHLARAVCCRVGRGQVDFDTLVPRPYHLNHPWLGRVTACNPPREVQKTKALSVNWAFGDKEPEVTDGTQGTCLTSIEKNFFSRCSKRSLFMEFRAVCEKFSRSDLLALSMYHEAKLAAKDFVTAKEAMFVRLRENGCGKWVSKPVEEEMFTLTDS